MGGILISFLGHLAGLTPVLLAYFIGMMLALVFWRRCPRCSLLVLLATVLLLATTLVQPFLVFYLTQGSGDFGWNVEKLGLMLGAIGISANGIRAAAFGLILAAVFIGRKGEQPSRADTTALSTGRARRPSEEQGITSQPN
jgi:hypothetical protein